MDRQHTVRRVQMWYMYGIKEAAFWVMMAGGGQEVERRIASGSLQFGRAPRVVTVEVPHLFEFVGKLADELAVRGDYNVLAIVHHC